MLGFLSLVKLRQCSHAHHARAVGGDIEVIIGGPPCQGFSHAGPRVRKDPRNRMVWEFLRFVEALRPTAFVMENVSGLLTTAQRQRGEFLEALRDEYWKLGYAARWAILDSADFRVPQRRKRLFLVGFRDRKREFTFPESPCGADGRMFSLPDPKQTTGDALSDVPTPIEADPQPYEREPSTWLQHFMRHGSKALSNHSPTRHSREMVKKIHAQEQGTRLYPNWNHSWYRLDPDLPAPAVKENHRAPFVHFAEDRVTSPRECARLQTFPDRFVFAGTKTAQLIQVGNAVP